MVFKYLIFLLCIAIPAAQLPDLVDTATNNCISCVCHAVTACYDLEKCANATIDYNYWMTAGSPRLSNDDSIDTEAFSRCQSDTNCILNTIHQYVTSNSTEAPICEPNDCRGVLTTHINRRNCNMELEVHRNIRYNNCARRWSLPTIDF